MRARLVAAHGHGPGLHPACANAGPSSAVPVNLREVAVAMVFEVFVTAGGLEDSAFNLVLAPTLAPSSPRIAEFPASLKLCLGHDWILL